MYALEEFISNNKVCYLKIRKKPVYKKATLKFFGWNIPTISWFLPIFGHFWLVQNDKWHQKFIFYIWGNFFKVLLSTLLLESMDYRSVGLKCLTQRFSVFPFSWLCTLLKKKLFVLIRPHPWVCLESRSKKFQCCYLIWKRACFLNFCLPQSHFQFVVIPLLHW